MELHHVFISMAWFSVGGFAGLRNPESGKAGSAQHGNLVGHEAPPLVLLIFQPRTVPVKRLHDDAHSPSLKKKAPSGLALR